MNYAIRYETPAIWNEISIHFKIPELNEGVSFMLWPLTSPQRMVIA
jgi:hypothetical protein